MRLENARPLVFVNNEQCCGHCLSRRVEFAEFEKVRYKDHEGDKTVAKPGYFCLDCGQISLFYDGPVGSPAAGPYPAVVPECSPIIGPKTW